MAILVVNFVESKGKLIGLTGVVKLFISRSRPSKPQFSGFLDSVGNGTVVFPVEDEETVVFHLMAVSVVIVSINGVVEVVSNASVVVDMDVVSSDIVVGNVSKSLGIDPLVVVS